jgi:hypothetical protein
MAAALVIPASLVIGQSLTVTATGLDDSENYAINIRNPDETMDVTIIVESGAGGTLDMGPVATVVPQAPGHYTVTLTDVTDADSSVSGVVEVFAA